MAERRMRGPGERWTRRSYAGETVDVARRMLGAYLVHASPDGSTAGRIVECEAYLGEHDPAAHSHRGETRRNAAMFGAPGTAYVYFVYGVHDCFNVVTAPRGIGQAVLVRALEPFAGLDLMTKRRGGVELGRLCRGPGNLARAMGIAPSHNATELARGALGIFSALEGPPRSSAIVTTQRVGLTRAAHLPLRFCLRGCAFVSAKRPHAS
ncbi:MAG: DNA-3-methyladenine glycosylase [Planctomycetota bacterium]